MNLNTSVKVTRCLATTPPGTTDVNGTVIDMAGFDGVLFVLFAGALSPGQVVLLKAQQGNQPDGSDAADLAGSAVGPFADGDSNKGLLLDVAKPTKRYLRAVVDRSTANAGLDAAIAIQYGPSSKPTTHDASIVAQKVVASPLEGTA